MSAAQETPDALRRRHCEMLAVAAVVTVLSFALQIRSDGRVTPPGLTKWPLPPTCMSNELFGVKCPGCGQVYSWSPELNIIDAVCTKCGRTYNCEFGELAT